MSSKKLIQAITVAKTESVGEEIQKWKDNT